MTAKSERLTVLSDAEQEALYGLPDFDDAQWLENKTNGTNKREQTATNNKR